VSQEALQAGRHLRPQGQRPDERLARRVHIRPDAERSRHRGGRIVARALLAGGIHLIAMPDGAVGEGCMGDRGPHWVPHNAARARRAQPAHQRHHRLA
jgi:hypothetical protein